MMRSIVLIIGALLLIEQGIYFAFNNWFFKPDMEITVKFPEVPPLIKFAGDVGVYYRGYKVGKVTARKLSNDQKHILFSLDITYRDLRLPINTKVILKTQDIFGDRYFDLIYPEDPSPKLLSDGDTLKGTAVFERLDKYLVEEMESGKTGELIANLNYLTKSLKSLVTDPATKKELDRTLSYAPQALSSVNQVTGLLGKTVTGLETVTKTIPIVSQDISGASSRIEGATNSIVKVSGNISGINQSLYKTNSLLYSTNYRLGNLDQKIPIIPQRLIAQTDRTLRRYDCIGQALSNTMNKNCLFLRFLFGTPGKAFSKCAGAVPPAEPSVPWSACPHHGPVLYQPHVQPQMY